MPSDMFRIKYVVLITISAIIALTILFSGCNSTNSEEGSNGTKFDSGEIAPDGTYSFTFKEEEIVEYYCSIHGADMQGTITVTSSVDAVDKDTVLMENTRFQPRDLSVAPNTEVVWINRDNVNHTVTSGDPPSEDDGYGY